MPFVQTLLKLVPRSQRSLLLVALLLASSPAVAQSSRVVTLEQNEQQHAANCGNAARFLSRGIPETQQDWAIKTIRNCSREAPAALATAIRRLATSRDTSALGALMQSAAYVGDDRIFDAALEVATQSGASAAARAAGFFIAAMEATDRLDFNLSKVVASTETIAACVGGLFDHSLRGSANTPLAPTVGTRLRTAIATVLADANTPLPVRNAAECVGPSARALP